MIMNNPCTSLVYFKHNNNCDNFYEIKKLLSRVDQIRHTKNMHDRDSDTNRNCSSQLKSHGVDLCDAPFHYSNTSPYCSCRRNRRIRASRHPLLLPVHDRRRLWTNLAADWVAGRSPRPPLRLCICRGNAAFLHLRPCRCYLGVVCNVCLCVNCGSLGCLALTRVPICTSLRWWAVPNVVNCEETCFRMVQDGVLCA